MRCIGATFLFGAEHDWLSNRLWEPRTCDLEHLILYVPAKLCDSCKDCVGLGEECGRRKKRLLSTGRHVRRRPGLQVPVFRFFFTFWGAFGGPLFAEHVTGFTLPDCSICLLCACVGVGGGGGGGGGSGGRQDGC